MGKYQVARRPRQIWVEMDIIRLRTLVAKGQNVHQIARQMGRTPRAISAKASKLKIPLVWRKT